MLMQHQDPFILWGLDEESRTEVKQLSWWKGEGTKPSFSLSAKRVRRMSHQVCIMQRVWGLLLLCPMSWASEPVVLELEASMHSTLLSDMQASISRVSTVSDSVAVVGQMFKMRISLVSEDCHAIDIVSFWRQNGRMQLLENFVMMSMQSINHLWLEVCENTALSPPPPHTHSKWDNEDILSVSLSF